MTKTTFTLAELIALTGVHRNTVYNWRKAGKLIQGVHFSYDCGLKYYQSAVDLLKEAK